MPVKNLTARVAPAAIVLALVLLAAIGVFAWQGAAQLATDGADLSRTQRVLALLATLQTSALEAESAQRGHALGGDAALLEAFGRAKDSTLARLAELRSTDAASAERYERLVALGALLNRRFDGLARAIDLRNRGGPVAVLQWEATGEGKRADERLRGVLSELQQHAEAERQLLQRRTESSARRAQGAAIAVGLAAIGVVGFALWQLRGTTRALQRAREERVGAVDGHQRADSESQRLFELAPDAVCVLDAECRIARVSATGATLWGWAAEDLLGKPANDKVVPEDQRKTEQALAAMLSSGTSQIFRNRWRRKDGSVAYLAWALQWSAQDRNMLCVARDVTEAERLRLAVSRQTQALQSASAELKQAVARADAAEGLQAVFVAAVGQSLRPPTEAILARSAQVIHGALAPDAAQRKHWAHVHEQADALQEAIADVLDCGAVEAGLVTLNKDAFDVWELLNQVASAARSRAERKGLTFGLQLADDLGYARGDTRRVEQVLRKLLHEAVSSTDAGAVALHASRQRDGMVCIEVHDDAIVPGDPAALFSPPTSDGAGAAAGDAAAQPVASVALVLSRRLARLMGGDLAARKGAPQGRVFVLTLPADDMNAAG